MLQLTIPFQTRWFTIRRTIRRKIPTAWDQLTTKQWKVVMEGLSQPDLDRRHIRLAKKLYRLRWYHLVLMDRQTQRARHEPEVKGFLLESLMESVEWISKTIEATTPIPTLGRFRKYHGPSKGLSNLTVGEFVYADTLFMAWHSIMQEYQTTENTPSSFSGEGARRAEGVLNQLVAVLYRRRGRGKPFRRESSSFQGDVRRPFNEHTVKQREKRMRYLPTWQKEAVITTYIACRHQWSETFKHLFNSSENSTGKPASWGDVLEASAGKPTEIDPVSKTLAYNWLKYLNRKTEEAKELQSRDETNG